MTKDELRKHCERMCARYAEANRVTRCLTYEEHKLVLDLLDTDDVLTKASVLKALGDIKAEIEALYDGNVCAKVHNCDKNVLDIITRKIAEVTKNEKV